MWQARGLTVVLVAPLLLAQVENLGGEAGEVVHQVGGCAAPAAAGRQAGKQVGRKMSRGSCWIATLALVGLLSSRGRDLSKKESGGPTCRQ